VRDERAHPELVSQSDGAPVVGLRLLHVGRIAARGHLAEEAKGIDLVASLFVLASQVERLSSELCRVLYSPCREPHLPKWNGSEQVVRDQLHRGGLVRHLAQKGNGLCGPIRERVCRPERCRDSVEDERGQPERVTDLQTVLERRHGGAGVPLPEVDHPHAHARRDQSERVLERFGRRSDSSALRAASANSPSSASDHVR
jgi:hypothetical protein